MNLTQDWNHLESSFSISLTAARLQRRIRPESRHDFFLGLEMPTMNRMLIFQAPSSALNRQAEIADSRGLAVRFGFGAADSIAEILLVLTEPDLASLFDLLIQDLVDTVEDSSSDRSAATAFLARLRDWQDLFAKLSGRGLSKRHQQGMWGEIWALMQAIEPAVGMVEAVASWQGPMGSAQDFEFESMSVEVKTRVGNSHQLLISSEKQLDVPEGTDLALLALSLDSRRGHGQSLPTMVRDCREAASKAGCREQVDNRLSMLGYADHEADLYDGTRYSVRSFDCYRVGPGFPRIGPEKLAVGVTDVRYSISLAACADYKIEISEPLDLLPQLRST